MKVNLFNIQEAEYEIKEDKCSKIPFDVFCKMGNIDLKKSNGNTYPSARFFNNIDDFKAVAEKDNSQFDKSKDVFVMPNGKICVLLAEYAKPVELNVISKDDKTDGTTDSKENKG